MERYEKVIYLQNLAEAFNQFIQEELQNDDSPFTGSSLNLDLDRISSREFFQNALNYCIPVEATEEEIAGRLQNIIERNDDECG